MTSDTSYVAQADVVDCDIGGDRALLHLQTNTYFTMNGTASALWLALSEPQTLEQLVHVVTDKFDVAADVCRGDIETLVGQMVDAQVIDVVPAKGA